MSQFDLNEQYRLYLERVALSEDAMHPTQKRQLKQTFFGACGQMMILLRDDLSALTEDEGVEILQGMLNQVGDFFLNEAKQSN